MLVPENEGVDEGDIGSGLLGDMDDTDVVDPCNETFEEPTRYNVSSYGWDSDVEGLVKRLDRDDIFVPGFQRGFVWTNPERSRFIESLILGLPVPNIFLAQDPITKSLNIVDGQQRLKSLQGYLNGKFYLTGANIEEDLKGCYFSEEVAKSKTSKVLSEADARSLADAVLHAIVIKPDAIHDDKTKGHEYNAAVIQIFHRLNTSGKPLSAQEIRASIFYGSFDALLRKLNEGLEWRELFGSVHSRLKDIELILRFIALRQNLDNYKAPMPRFLDEFMEDHRHIDEAHAEQLASAFSKVVTLVNSTIGKEGLKSGSTLTVARFDAIMAGFDAYVSSRAELNEAEIPERLAALEADKDYQWSIEKFVNDTDRAKKRIERARVIFGA